MTVIVVKMAIAINTWTTFLNLLRKLSNKICYYEIL